MKITTKKGAFGFGAFIQTIRDFFTIQKLSCNAQLWTWREGAKKTLNPIPAMLYTLKEIWSDGYVWHGGTWLNDPKENPNNITEDTKLNFLSKCYASWDEVFRDIFSKYRISWRYGNGYGSWGYTRFKWWNLTYYRDHTEWYDDRYQHSWKDKKFLFAKNWKDYDHKYVLHCSHGTWEKKISEEEFETSLDSEEVSYE